MLRQTDDLRITQVRPLIPPAILLEELPISERASNVVSNTRLAVAEALEGRDPRLVVIVGPCSIHDTGAALEYARRLAPLAERYADHLDRDHAQLLREAADLGRLEGPDQRSRSRRELSHQQGPADGPPAPARRQRSRPADGVGIPRHADPAAHRRPHVVGGDRRADHGEPGAPGAGVGTLDAGRLQEQHRRQPPDRGRRGADGALAALVPVGDQAGRVGAIFHTTGNDTCHVILRGGSRTGPNYEAEHVGEACALLAAKGLGETVMVDCSHGNSLKDHGRQADVAASICRQVAVRLLADLRRDARESPGRRTAGLRAGPARGLRPEHHRRLHLARDDRPLLEQFATAQQARGFR